ncbi:MAG: hypothetical protein PHV74_14965, partial [Dehalococcoidia bacterium]|nr:hypothetical protein [Dehalococcoidia bacterium]
QYNLPPFPKKLAYKANRSGVVDRFDDPGDRKSVEVDLHLLDFRTPVFPDKKGTNEDLSNLRLLLYSS